MKKAICVLFIGLVGCGAGQTGLFPGGTAGKADWQKPTPIVWKDGSRTAGKYVNAQVDFYSPEYLQNVMPEDLEQYPHGYYLIDASPDLGVVGHLGFFVDSDSGFRLGSDSFYFAIDVELLGNADVSDFDVALLKFYEGKTYSMMVSLKEALDGVILTSHREAREKTGMIDTLQSVHAEAEREGFAGTWKVIVVPRDRAKQSREVGVYGAEDVEVVYATIEAVPLAQDNPSQQFE